MLQLHIRCYAPHSSSCRSLQHAPALAWQHSSRVIARTAQLQRCRTAWQAAKISSSGIKEGNNNSGNTDAEWRKTPRSGGGKPRLSPPPSKQTPSSKSSTAGKSKDSSTGSDSSAATRKRTAKAPPAQHQQQQQPQPQQQQQQQQQHKRQQSPAGRPSKQGRFLSGAVLSQAANVKDLSQLVQQHASSMSAISVAAAYTRLGKLCQQYAALAATATARELLQHLDQQLPSVQQQMDPRGLSNIIWACAHAQHQSTASRQLLPLFLDGRVLSVANAFDISNVVWAVATTEGVLSSTQLQQVLAVYVKQLPSAVPQGIANVLWGVSTMQQQVPAQQLQVMLTVFTGQLHRATPQNISNTLWAVAKMGQQLPQQQQQRMLTALAGHLHRAKPQEISNTLWAVAEMGQQVPQQQLQQMLTALAGQLHRAKPQEISNTLWAVAEMGQQVPQQQLQQMLTGLMGQLHMPKPQESSNILWAMAKMGQQVPQQQLQQMLSGLTSQLSGAVPQAISNSLWACARLRQAPTQLLAALEQQEQQLQRLLSAANPQNLANIAWACAQLGHRGQLSGAVLDQASKLLDQESTSNFNSQHLCNLCWSAAVLNMPQHTPAVWQLTQACKQIWSCMEPEELQQLYQVHLWLLDCQLPAGSQALLGVLTGQQLEQCRNSWEQQLTQTAAESKASQLHKAVFNSLQQLPASTWQQPPIMEQHTADGAFSIDIAAVTAAGVRVAMEVSSGLHCHQHPLLGMGYSAVISKATGIPVGQAARCIYCLLAGHDSTAWDDQVLLWVIRPHIGQLSHVLSVKPQQWSGTYHYST